MKAFPRSVATFLAIPTLLVASLAAGQIVRSEGPDGVITLSRPKSTKRPPPIATNRIVMPRSGDGDSSHRYDDIIREAASLYQLPEALVRAVIQVESNFDPAAVSPANAHGLMQMIPSTAASMMVTDIHDPRQNVFGGTRYLRLLANRFGGNLQLTIAAYNAGEGSILRYGGIPPFAETQQYVKLVLHHYRRFLQEEGR